VDSQGSNGIFRGPERFVNGLISAGDGGSGDFFYHGRESFDWTWVGIAFTVRLINQEKTAVRPPVRNLSEI
jgi:hypothetical protein